VVFAITQAPLPASRQATNQSAHDNKYKSRATPNNANPPQPTTLVPTQNDGGQSLKSEREGRTSNQDHAAVNISNSAPMSEWTWHDKVAWFFELVLTAFLIWGVIVARTTLKNIERQTKAIEDGTRIARENVEILISKERAKVILTEELPKSVPSLEPGYSRESDSSDSLEMDEFKIMFQNTGVTSAYNVTLTCSVTISKDGQIVHTESGFDERGTMNGGATSESEVTFFPGMSQTQLDSIHNGQEIVLFSGTISYNDAFQRDREKPWITSFSYQWEINEESVDFTDDEGIDRVQSQDMSGWIKYPKNANYST
jgi:hypothetical protein